MDTMGPSNGLNAEFKQRSANVQEDLSNLLADMQRRYREIDAELAEVEFVFANIRDTLTKLNSAFLKKKES